MDVNNVNGKPKGQKAKSKGGKGNNNSIGNNNNNNNNNVNFDSNANNNGVGVTKANNSMMTNLLLVWARFFDSIKCYIDSISEVINVNYDTINENRNLGIILPLLCKRAGFEFREILPSPLQNKLDGENLTFDDIKSENTIRNIQNVL